MSFGIFKQIEMLVEYIPIQAKAEGIGKLEDNTNIDTQFHFKDLGGMAVTLGVIEVEKKHNKCDGYCKIIKQIFKRR